MAVELEPVEGTEDLLLAVQAVVVGQLVWSDGTRNRFEKVLSCMLHRIHQNSYK